MTGRPAEELLQLYQELTHPGGNYYTSTSIQPQRRGYADVRPASGGVGVGDSSTPVNVSTRNGHAAASLRGDGGANRSKHHATSANDDRKGDGKDIQLRAWRVTAEDGVGKINNKSSSGSRRYTTRSSHNHAVGQGSASVGLVNSRSGSTRLSARLAQALKQHRGDPDINNGNLDNPQPNDVGTSGIPDGDGVIHRHVELSLSSQPEASQRFACWLCETPCAGPTWSCPCRRSLRRRRGLPAGCARRRVRGPAG
ncbi:hypothetical protein DQ04_10731000 [Trypanosoma grayi]|uniref:hypothetical protein n=1 Tax=Trypanosoma grayi TaxID=71804 RepID=UPI0004F41442|nr:hypothetical protein DQ04_10731000 [Trypanosoma grayi]KEG07151.1 hypothetical protein DQ04_10731000 [Trypanosoma grayi]